MFVFISHLTVPVSLVSMVADRRPEVVALSAALLPHVGQVAAVVRALRELPEPPFILVGGRAFLDNEALARHIGADATAADARAAVELLRNRFAA
jgi:methanogenic corrinoid protein MtbC1